MNISARGLELIAEHEGLRLKAYRCPANVWTIGYGHTKDVRPGDTCTKQQALEYLREDCADAEAAVRVAVDVPLNQNQFDALVSFVFNVGAGAFRASTLLKLLNGGNYGAVSEQLLRWNKARGITLAGLTKRRMAEADLFDSAA